MLPPLNPKRTDRYKVCIAWCLLFAGGVFAPMHSSAAETITMAFIDNQQQDVLFKTAELVYREAFRRLGLGFAHRQYPTLRCGVMANNGEVDGEPARVGNYANAYPNLIRVEEPVLTLKTAAFAGNPSLSLNGWDSLKNTPYRVEYLKNSVNTERELSQRVPAERLSDVGTISQGLKKLQAGHTDIFVGTEAIVMRILARESFKDKGIHQVGVMQEITLYPFLHKKHSPLAPKLAEVLRQMKAEGVFEQYQTAAVKASNVTR